MTLSSKSDIAQFLNDLYHAAEFTAKGTQPETISISIGNHEPVTIDLTSELYEGIETGLAEAIS